MSMTDDQDVLTSMTRIIQIIAGSLIAGVVVMLVMSVVVIPTPLVGARRARAGRSVPAHCPRSAR